MIQQVMIIILLFAYKLIINAQLNLSPPLLIKGSDGTSFGFSLALHKLIQNNQLESNIIIGSPFDEKYGKVFICSLQNEQNCSRTFINNENSIFNSDNSLFGKVVKVHPTTGDILVCAHRLNMLDDVRSEYMLIGGCLYYNQSYFLKRYISPCKKIALDDIKLHGYSRQNRYANCMAGFSAQITNDYIYLTAPGTFQSSGIIVSFNKTNLDYLKDSFSSNENHLFSEYGFFPRNYQADLADEILDYPIRDYYTGYSLAIGYFRYPNILDIAAGAPRTNHYGKVIIFTNTVNNIINSNTLILDENSYQYGVGSGYGYSLASIDLNEDGLTDLLVGAPFFYNKKLFDNGRVFIYLSQGKGIFAKPIHLFEYDSRRFGNCIVSLGDIDNDETPNFAVGSPMDDDGSGAVYIYSWEKLNFPKLIKKISANSLKLNSPLKYFGFSISDPYDVDNNGYSDFAIGAPKSSSAIIYMFYNIFDVKVTWILYNEFIKTVHNCSILLKPTILIYNLNETLDGLKTTSCFSIGVKIWYSERKGINIAEQEISVSLMVDVGLNQRIYIIDSTKHMNITINPKLITFNAFIIPSPTLARFPDVEFILNVSQNDSNMNNKAIVSNKRTFEKTIPIEKICITKECSPDLKIIISDSMKIGYGSNQVSIPIQILNSGNADSAYLVQLQISMSKWLSYVGNSLNSPILQTFESDTTILFKELINEIAPNDSMNFTVFLSIVDHSKILPHTNLSINISSVNKESTNQLMDNYQNLMLIVQSEVNLQVTGYTRPSIISYGGNIVGISSFHNRNDIGKTINHYFTVTNSGNDAAIDASLFISWPSSSYTGRYLLYLVDIEANGLYCTVENGSINPSNIPIDDINDSNIHKDGSREKRAIDSNQESKPNIKDGLKKDGRKQINCFSNTAKCADIVCKIDRIESHGVVQVVVKSKLWNSTILLENYGQILEIFSNAHVNLSTTNRSFLIKEIDSSNNRIELPLEVNPDFFQPTSSLTPWWVYLISTAGGIILLGLFMLLLYKLGFFKRKSPNKYKSLQHTRYSTNKEYSSVDQNEQTKL